MRMVIAVILVMLTLTAEAYAAEPPFPWELPPDQLGPLLKEQYQKAVSKEFFDHRFVRPGKFGKEILCTSESDLLRWQKGTPKDRDHLFMRGKCFHEPVGWYSLGYVTDPVSGKTNRHTSFRFIDPKGTTVIELWTLAGFGEWNKPSCEEEIGLKQANIYRKQCLQVSSATHPPCSVKNTCSLMIEHIDYMCHRLREDVDTDESWRQTFETQIRNSSNFCQKYVPNW